MMSRDAEIWAERKKALDRAILETIEWAESELGAHKGARDSFENGQLEACLQSLRALRHFGSAAFEFFGDVFQDEAAQPEGGLAPQYVFRTLMDQMSIDLNVLQKAMFQRRRGSDGSMMEQAKTLGLADSLALNALRPALESGYIKASAVVTHLAREFDVRLIPYYDVVLIGIPYSTYNDNGVPTLDFLAIPHEVGHFLYERGKVPGTDMYVEDVVLEKTGLGRGDWRYNWLEELFSDAYGCLVAGPVNVFSFQKLLQDSSPDELREDSGEHPIPILRPLIQTQMLRRITDAQAKPIFINVPDRLDEAWREWVGDGDVLADSYQLQGEGQTRTGQQIAEALNKVIAGIFETLELLMPRNAAAVWTGDLESGDDLAKLARQFAIREYPVQEQGYYRFKERLAEFKAGAPAMDELIRLVLFEDWETEHGLGDRER
jgi:hypothetical protein